jgi:SAM-dependent methyltransferase
MQPNTKQLKCLLCGSSDYTKVSSLTSGELQKAWAALEIHFSEAAWKVIEKNKTVLLWRCLNCNFEFCDPNLAGKPVFYEELQAQSRNYYPDSSAEFSRALNFALENDVQEILDVGCGSGAFLNLAKSAGLSTFGIELNPKAAELARKAGHRVFDTLVSDLIQQERHPQSDMVTAWQVLEHVPDPLDFLNDCSQLVKPNGFIGVAVPSEEGIYRLCRYDPHLWPPHHISRWRVRDLKQIGALANLKFVFGGTDPLNGAVGQHFWNLHNRIAPAIGVAQHPGQRWLPKILWFLYRKSGARHFLPNYGPSIYAFYQKI